MTLIANCAINELGGVTGGRKGDQTGREYHVTGWYAFGQGVVMRHPSAKVRSLMAELAREAAENDAIGYGWEDRESFWRALPGAGYRPARITARCETDCSASTAAIAKAAGHLLGDARLMSILPDTFTGNLRQRFGAAGFTPLTGSRYVAAPDWLLAGDVILNEGRHVTIAVTDGGREDVPERPNAGSRIEVDGVMGRDTIGLWQVQLGTTYDPVVSGQPHELRHWHPALVAVDYGWGGSQLVAAVQRRVGVDDDSYWGRDTSHGIQEWLVDRGYDIGPCGVDDIFGHDCAVALQRSLNAGEWSE